VTGGDRARHRKGAAARDASGLQLTLRAVRSLSRFPRPSASRTARGRPRARAIAEKRTPRFAAAAGASAAFAARGAGACDAFAARGAGGGRSIPATPRAAAPDHQVAIRRHLSVLQMARFRESGVISWRIAAALPGVGGLSLHSARHASRRGLCFVSPRAAPRAGYLICRRSRDSFAHRRRPRPTSWKGVRVSGTPSEIVIVFSQ